MCRNESGIPEPQTASRIEIDLLATLAVHRYRYGALLQFHVAEMRAAIPAPSAATRTWVQKRRSMSMAPPFWIVPAQPVSTGTASNTRIARKACKNVLAAAMRTVWEMVFRKG